MISLNYFQIRHPIFNKTMERLLETSMPIPTAARLLRLLDQIKTAQEESDRLWAEIAKRYLEEVPGSDNQMRLKEDMPDAWKEEAISTISEFNNTPVDIKGTRLLSKELESVKLSPGEVMILTGLIEVE